jgi:hypothetical protein
MTDIGEIQEEITLESLSVQVNARLDMLGEQMNWLCENLASLFGFVNQIGNNGGGIRGMMKAMKQSPELLEQMGQGEQQ